MKKLILILTIALLIAILCSCNSDKDAVVNENTTAIALNNSKAETEINGDTTEGEVVKIEETTQKKPPVAYEKLVYTDMDLENIAGLVDEDVLVEEMPEKISMGAWIPNKKLDVVKENKNFTFYGETYNLDFKMAMFKENSKSTNGRISDIEYHIYNEGDTWFHFVNGTDKLIEVSIKDKKDVDASRKEISVDQARIIADSFMETYSLAESIDGLEVSYVIDDTMYRFWYRLYIGGYEVLDEFYMVGVNKNGDICHYSDNYTGLFDQFIGKVTEADLTKAESCVFPYILPGAYDFSEPCLTIGSDGNLYMNASYWVDESAGDQTYGHEYMFYSRVFCEE